MTGEERAMQTFLMVTVVLVLLAPVLLFQGLPFIAAAGLLFWHAPAPLDGRARVPLACAIAAVGIAPAFDDFWQPRSAWLRVLDGEPVGPWALLASLVMTWAALYGCASLLAARRGRRHA
jgi:hypothetical protein